jgi:integrase
MAEAKRVHNELVLQVERKINEAIVPTWPLVVEQFLKACLERDISRKTVENYAVCLEAHTGAWEKRLVDSITTEEVRALIKERVGDKATSHQKNLLKFIRGAFTYAVEAGVLQRNPTPQMKFRLGDKIKKVLTEEQIRVLLNRAKELDSEWYPHWALALYTGMRNGELFALTWDKVNLDNRQILVDSSFKLQSGDTTFVLPRIDKWDGGEQARELRMFLTGLGLPPVRFHDLRASWATVLLSKGVEPIKVMKMGGWKDMKTMMIYARKAGVDIKGATDCLELHNPSAEAGKVLKFSGGSNP